MTELEELQQARISPTWTAYDLRVRKLPASYLYQPKARYWQQEEVQKSLCLEADLYKPKPSFSADQLATMTLEQKNEIISHATQDAILLHPQGPVQWMLQNPQAHVKLAVKAITPVDVGTEVRITVDAAWLNRDRLSYKEAPPLPIEDATVKSWKEPSEVSQVLSELTKLDGAK